MSLHYKSDITWNQMWLQMAFVVAQRSKDPNTKVGAVVVSSDNRRCTVGYNGFPAGLFDHKRTWNNRDTEGKEACKYDLVIHAEMNAILNAPFNLTDFTLYCTHFPCMHCAKHIVQAGIRKIVTPTNRAETKMDGREHKVLELFRHKNVALVELTLPERS